MSETGQGEPAGTLFFRAYDRDGRTNSVAAWTDYRMFVWIPNTNEWHRNRPLEVDFLIDLELRYEEVDVSVVPSIMDAAQPVDERDAGWLVDEFRAQPPEDRRTSADLGIRP